MTETQRTTEPTSLDPNNTPYSDAAMAFKHISVVIAARNEAAELAATVGSFLQAGAGEIIVVDDGSTDGCAEGLTDRENVRVIRNAYPTGTNQARNTGAYAASGCVLVFSDAHVRFQGDLRQFCFPAVGRRRIMCATVVAMKDGSVQGFGAFLQALEGHKVGYEVKYHSRRPEKRYKPISAVIGSVYAMHRGTFNQLQGFCPNDTWGYDEEGLSIKALMANVGMYVDRDTTAVHQFRDTHPFAVTGEMTEANRMLAHRIIFSEATWAKEKPIFYETWPKAAAMVTEKLYSEQTQYLHDQWQKRRVFTDEHIAAIAERKGQDG